MIYDIGKLEIEIKKFQKIIDEMIEMLKSYYE